MMLRSHDHSWVAGKPRIRTYPRPQDINELDPYVARVVGTTAALVMGGLAAAGTLGGAAIQAHSAGSAADKQSAAAQSVIQQAKDAATAATSDVNTATTTADTGLQGGLQAQLAALKPYIDSGAVSLSDLQKILSPTGDLATSQFAFNPATSPQLQFEQQQAQQALQRQQAATGTVLGGGEIRASNIMNTGLASTYLNQSFNQALETYNTNRQNLLTRIQGLTNLTGLGFNATGAENQDIGNTTMRTAANQISAGRYAGDTGLKAAQIAEEATTGSANAQSAADIASGKAAAGAVSNIANLGGLTYGLATAPGPSASSQPGWTGTPAPPPEPAYV